MAVWIRNADSAADRDTARVAVVDIMKPNPFALGPTDEAGRPLTIQRLVANTPPPAQAGTPITWTALATGGRAPHAFQFWVVNGSNRTLGRDWDASNIWTWTPLLPGPYSVEVWGRSAGSTRTSARGKRSTCRFWLRRS